MTTRYKHWHYPSFINPDPNAALASVAICTVDREFNLFFNHTSLPEKYYKKAKLVSDYMNAKERYYHDRGWERGHIVDARDDSNINVMVFNGTRYPNLDLLSEKLDILATIDPVVFDNTWFKEALIRDKIDAGLSAEDPANYDVVMPVDNEDCKNLRRIIGSCRGGTIQLNDEADHAIREKLLSMSDSEVTFTKDNNNINNIRFHWATPYDESCLSTAQEYNALGRICAITDPLFHMNARINSNQPEPTQSSGRRH